MLYIVSGVLTKTTKTAISIIHKQLTFNCNTPKEALGDFLVQVIFENQDYQLRNKPLWVEISEEPTPKQLIENLKIEINKIDNDFVGDAHDYSTNVIKVINDFISTLPEE